MLRIFLLTAALVALALGFACTSDSGGGSTPTDAYKRLYSSVKSKNVEAIKSNLTKKSLDFGEMAAGQQKISPDKVYENGFTATTFAATLPEIRDERVKDNMGSVEVWNSKDRIWEDLPFVFEDGAWKLAIGEMFAGTFVSPGRGRDSLEREAANAVAGNMVPMTSANGNTIPGNVNIIKPQQRDNTNVKK